MLKNSPDANYDSSKYYSRSRQFNSNQLNQSYSCNDVERAGTEVKTGGGARHISRGNNVESTIINPNNLPFVCEEIAFDAQSV